MASQSKPADLVVDQVLELDPATIEVSDDSRIGFFFPEKAEAYAVLMAANGQRDPIKVRRNGNRAQFPWTLVAGRHRHAGCVIAGMKVRAIEAKGDADALRAVQASENLDRRDLAPLEKAMFVAATADAAKARLKSLHGGKSQQQIAIEQRWNGEEAGSEIRSVKMTDRMDKVQFTPVEKADAEAEAIGEALSSTYRWSDATAAACGMGVESLKRSLRIFRVIVEPNRDLMDVFKDHAVASNASALLSLCAQGNNPANVRAAIEWLIAHPEAKSADEALAALELMPSRGGAPAAAPDAKRLSSFIGTFGRMPLAEKKGALGQLGAMLPAGFEIVEKGQRSASVSDVHAPQLRDALSIAFDVIAKLSIGDPVDDDEIEKARAVGQDALLATHGIELNNKGEAK